MLRFIDSFDAYSDLNIKWTDAVGGINLTGTLSRTGIGCVNIGAFGPGKSTNPVQGTVTGLVCGTAGFQPNSETGCGFQFIDDDPVTLDLTVLVRVEVEANLGIRVLDAHLNVVGVSAPNIVVANAYNYIEAKCFFHATQGSCVVHLNGQEILNLTNLFTFDPARCVVGANKIQLLGACGAGGVRHDDFYLLDTTGARNNNFLGPIKIYAIVPSANSAPLQWTPLAGTNFSQVNEVPPDGDTSYVTSGTLNDTDQYVYNVGVIPPGSIVFGLQHTLDAEVTAGSVVLSSCVNGIAAPGIALGGNYAYAITPYDTNPATGLPWSLTDFPGTVLGPKITG